MFGRHRALPGRRRRRLGDAAHAGRVVVAAGQQRLAGRRAQRRGVEAVVPQTAGGEALGGRRVARPAERARRAEADVVEQDHQHVRARPPAGAAARSAGTTSPGPWRRRWSDPVGRTIRDRQDRAGMPVGGVGHRCLRSTQPAMLTSSSRCGVRGIARLGDPMRCHGRASTPGGTSRCARRARAVRDSSG